MPGIGNAIGIGFAAFVDPYGPELATGWNTAIFWSDNVAANWSVVGSTLVSSGTGNWQKYGFLTNGKTYRMVVNVTRTSGTVRPFWDGVADVAISTSGTHTFIYVCAGINPFMSSSAFVGIINSISIKEVL